MSIPTKTNTDMKLSEIKQMLTPHSLIEIRRNTIEWRKIQRDLTAAKHQFIDLSKTLDMRRITPPTTLSFQ